MKFKINRDHFANGLAQVLNVVGSKATMPILSNVLIEAEKDQISLTTTNLDLGIRCRIKAEVKETGSVTLPVKRLATIVRELPNVDVTVDASPNHQVKLTSGGSNFRIRALIWHWLPNAQCRPSFWDRCDVAWLSPWKPLARCMPAIEVIARRKAS